MKEVNKEKGVLTEDGNQIKIEKKARMLLQSG